ncbi:MAG: universal stress protein [Spirochaetaceae bacterium]|jgi:nucleotide-binding universal stress UspA family protein|nr:universal stress protein [Spirochaetaceae bacterium]
MKKPLVSSIVAAISGSNASILAAKYAIVMAKQYKCRLCAVNVIDTNLVNELFLEKILVESEASEYESFMESNGRRFLDFVVELAAAKGVKITTDLRRGAVFAEIICAANEHNSDLIILGGSKKERISSGIHCEILLRSDCSILVSKDPNVDLKYRQL